jgi:hypothetical protein
MFSFDILKIKVKKNIFNFTQIYFLFKLHINLKILKDFNMN